MEYKSLCSGSDGNCYLVRSGGTLIAVDCGMSARRLVGALREEGIEKGDLNGIVLTHSHKDHTLGVATMVYKHHVPLYCTRRTLNDLERRYGREFDRGSYREVVTGEEFAIGGLRIVGTAVDHDTPDCHSYTITDEAGRRLTIATDLGYVPEGLMARMGESDAVVLESNYSETMLAISKYPPILRQRIDSDSGHLSNTQCGEAIGRLRGSRCKRVHLAHISVNSNTHEIALGYAWKCAGEWMEVDALGRREASEWYVLGGIEN